ADALHAIRPGNRERRGIRELELGSRHAAEEVLGVVERQLDREPVCVADLGIEGAVRAAIAADVVAVVALLDARLLTVEVAVAADVELALVAILAGLVPGDSALLVALFARADDMVTARR